MTIYHIPKVFVKAPDPREQDVIEQPYALPSPGVTDPIEIRAERPHLLALRGQLPAEHCSGCGQAMAYHYDTTGINAISCKGALARKRLGLVNPFFTWKTETVWGDLHPKVSQAVGDGLLAACGPAVSIFFDTLTHQEQINLTRRLAEIAVLALRDQDAQREQGA